MKAVVLLCGGMDSTVAFYEILRSHELVAALSATPLDPRPPGRDLLAPDAANAASRPYMATLGGSLRMRFGLVDGDYKFVISEREGVWDGRLTRRGRDEVDLAAAAPQIASRMRQRLKHIRARMARGRAEVRQELSEQERESLRALGYVEEPETP